MALDMTPRNLADAMLAAGFSLSHTRSALSNLVQHFEGTWFDGSVLADDVTRLTRMEFGQQFSVEVSFVQNHEELRDGGLQDNERTHRVTVMAHSDMDAMLVAAQMVASRGMFVTGTTLVL